MANPPRVIFDEPFHQEYDRFMEMTVLILFDKKIKKKSKIINNKYFKKYSLSNSKLNEIRKELLKSIVVSVDGFAK